MTIQEIAYICDLNQEEYQEIQRLQSILLQPQDSLSHIDRYVVVKYSQNTIDTIKVSTGEMIQFQWQELQQFLELSQRDYYHKILRIIIYNDRIISASLDKQIYIYNVQNFINTLRIPQSNDIVKRNQKQQHIQESANSFNVFTENIFSASLNNDEEEFNINNIEEVFQPIVQDDFDSKKFKFSDRPDSQFIQQRTSSFTTNILSPLTRPRSSSGILQHLKQVINTQIFCIGRIEIQLENNIFIAIPQQCYNLTQEEIIDNKENYINFLRNYHIKNGIYLIACGISQNNKQGDIVKFELQPFSYEVNTFTSVKEQQDLFEVYAQNIEILDSLQLQQQRKSYFIEGNTYQGIIYSYNEKDNFGFIKSVGEHKKANSLSQGLELYFKNNINKNKQVTFQIGDLVTFKCHWMNDRPQARDIMPITSCIRQNMQGVLLTQNASYMIMQLINMTDITLLSDNLIFVKRKAEQLKDNLSQSSAQSQKYAQIGCYYNLSINVDISGHFKATSYIKLDKMQKDVKFIQFYQNIRFSKTYPLLVQNQCQGRIKQSNITTEIQDSYICSFYGLIDNFVVFKSQDNILLLLDKSKTEIQSCYKQQVEIIIQDNQSIEFYQLDNSLAIFINYFRII